MNEVWRFLDDFYFRNGPFEMVIERFDYRQGQSRANLLAVEVIGIIKEWCRQKGIPPPYEHQAAQKVDTYFTRDRLLDAGLWKPGKNYKHAMDALRHLLYWRRDWLTGDGPSGT